MTTIVPGDDLSTEERWRQWQLRYAAGSRTSATRARIVFTIILTALAAWLGLELFSSPL